MIIDITDDFNERAEYATRISIFLSLWDAHVNWAPFAGRILSISYHPGTFTLAYLPKSSEKNERNDITFLAVVLRRVVLRLVVG